jgi:hypothetical protein
MTINPFDDEWRDCLRAHYAHVIRTGDKVTEPSLTVVLHQVGFSDSELAELRVLATMHVDDVPADFVPDLNVLATPPAEEPRIFPAVEIAPPPVTVMDDSHILEADLPEMTAEDQAEPEAFIEDEPEPEPEPPVPIIDPQQMSFF